MVVCADTSFLVSLYGNDAHSHRALRWVKSAGCLLSISDLTDYELGNALRFAEFSRRLAEGLAAKYWAHYELDRAAGRIRLEVCNLASVVSEARRLSSTHTLTGGHRAFDILHVATALHLRATSFLTFDDNQRKLAVAEGMNVPI